jgi:hypothetical protein
MAILGVPDIVIREAIDIRIEVTVRVHIDIRDEMQGKPSIPTAL